MTRIAFLHTGAVVISAIAEQAARHLPQAEVLNLLDDRIVADLGAGGTRAESVVSRLSHLARAARDAGAETLMLTCSSISGYAAGLADTVRIPVLRIDEAMADAAVAAGSRIAVVATLPTTLVPTTQILRERGDLRGTSPEVAEVLVKGAFDAAVNGDRQAHDRLVVAAIEAAADGCDVVVLAQASMASAASGARVSVPVLTSPELGVARLAEFIGRHDG